jgi:hypothetical protein
VTTRPEQWLLDTNVWIFGLRRDKTFPACAQLLDRLGSFSVVIPLQVLKELNLTLTETEMRDFYRLINQNSDVIKLSWQPAPLERVTFYQERGCRKGDASDCCSRRSSENQNDHQRKSPVSANPERDSNETNNRGRSHHASGIVLNQIKP